jgi:hypothetical protein
MEQDPRFYKETYPRHKNVSQMLSTQGPSIIAHPIVESK